MTRAEPVLDEENRADADWLAARRRADARAREHAMPLVRTLERHLAPGPAHGIDIGAGTGANHAYLTARLAIDTRWTVLDHDPDLLDHPTHLDARRILAGIAELPELIEPDQAARSFLTCSAVLDVLRGHDVDALADVILGQGFPALFSMSVTGHVAIRPDDPLDDLISEAFNAHQRRDGRLGPDAHRHLAELLPADRLQQVRTPWQLRAPVDAGLLRPYLTERAEVAVHQDPALAGPAERWLADRLGQVDDGRLAVEVDHVDQLFIPAG